MLTSDLIGCPYPVKDMDGNVVCTQPIASAELLANVAAVVIKLDSKSAGILISLVDAINLVENKDKK